jgi:hypothetical protein
MHAVQVVTHTTKMIQLCLAVADPKIMTSVTNKTKMPMRPTLEQNKET